MKRERATAIRCTTADTHKDGKLLAGACYAGCLALRGRGRQTTSLAARAAVRPAAHLDGVDVHLPFVREVDEHVLGFHRLGPPLLAPKDEPDPPDRREREGREGGREGLLSFPNRLCGGRTGRAEPAPPRARNDGPGVQRCQRPSVAPAYGKSPRQKTKWRSGWSGDPATTKAHPSPSPPTPPPPLQSAHAARDVCPVPCGASRRGEG